MQKKNPKAKTKSWYKKKIDEVFSQLIRKERPACQRCGTPNNLQHSHIRGRAYMATRWDRENAFSLCYGCHLFWWHRADCVEVEEWMFTKINKDQYNRIREKSLSYCKFSMSDLKEMLEGFKTELKQLS